MRRALGYKLRRTEKLLAQLIAYVETSGTARSTIDAAVAWATLPAKGDDVLPVESNHLADTHPGHGEQGNHGLVGQHAQRKGECRSCGHQGNDLQVAPSRFRPPCRHQVANSPGGAVLSRLRHIRVGAAHKNRKVHLLIADADVRIVTQDGELLRALTLEPNRNYYGLGGRWPVHNVLQQVSSMS